MNKKTIIAYVLIGLVVIGFFKFNQKSPEDIKKEKAYNEYVKQQEEIKKAQKELETAERQAKFDEFKQDTAGVFYKRSR